jgi:putative transcriptional regulator
MNGFNSEREGALNALLADYAAGHLNPALHSLVAAHLEMKPDNRSFVSSLEAVHARALEDVAPVELSNRQAILDRVFAAGDRQVAGAVRKRSASLPEALYSYVGRDLEDVKWRSVLPGLKEFRISDKGSETEASLLWIRSGSRMPAHTHDGQEVTLVLKGAFSDTVGHYGRGDISIADGDIDHRPRADDSGDCICFAVTDAPLRLTGPIGRFLQRFTGH